MIAHPFQPLALDPKPDDRKLDAKRLALQVPCEALIDADDALIGMQMGNLILAAVYGVKRME